MWLKDWRRRYFELKGNKLYFKKGPSDEAHGMIDLGDCLTVKSADERTNKRCPPHTHLRPWLMPRAPQTGLGNFLPGGRPAPAG